MMTYYVFQTAHVKKQEAGYDIAHLSNSMTRIIYIGVMLYVYRRKLETLITYLDLNLKKTKLAKLARLGIDKIL